LPYNLNKTIDMLKLFILVLVPV